MRLLNDITLIICISLSTSVQASTIVADSLGPSDLFQSSGRSLGDGKELAQTFTSLFSGYLSDIWLPVSLSGDPDLQSNITLEVWLATYDENGPLSVLETFSTNQIPARGNDLSLDVTHLQKTTSLWLDAGTTYWLGARALGGGSLAWMLTDPSLDYNGYHAWRDTSQGSSWTVISPSPFLSVNGDELALRVAVNAVPVPSGVWLFTSGILALFNVSRRAHRLTQ